GQVRGRTEIAPDQREKFLQKLQQVQQQGPSTLLNMPSLVGGNHKPFSSQQQNPLLQQICCGLALACIFELSGRNVQSHFLLILA
ncbi:CCR4-NOT transcription complex subunit 3-like, partial [Trifolium medium]|nr:CCR4-NOT transcription complex subunit 3-like [Trifolium medium]